MSTSDSFKQQIFIACSQETLFTFFITPEKMVRWMGQQVMLDPSIGGKFVIDVNGSDIAMGEYQEITPFEKIVMSWGWKKSKLVPAGSSTVAFTLTPQENGTLLELVHSNLPAEEVAPHDTGWKHYIERLQMLAEGQDPGVDPWAGKAV